MPSAPTEPGPRERRVDARRNLEAIIEAARDLLARDASASMGAIAAAAGVHRATVHRHFAAREDLLAAVSARADEESLAVLREARAAGGTPADALLHATERWIDLVDRYRVPQWRGIYAPVEDAEVRHDLRGLLDEVMADGIAAGELRGDVPADVLAALWIGMVIAAGQSVSEGQTTLRDAARHVMALVRA